MVVSSTRLDGALRTARCVGRMVAGAASPDRARTPSSRTGAGPRSNRSPSSRGQWPNRTAHHPHRLPSSRGRPPRDRPEPRTAGGSGPR